MKKYTFWLMLLALGTLTINVFAQKNKPSNTDTIVVSTFHDTYVTATGDPNVTVTNNYTMRSDLLGSYINGANSATSSIQGIGDWELDLLLSTREVFFDFSSATGTNIDGIAAPNSDAYPVRFLSQCSVRPGKRLQDLKMIDGTIHCPLNASIKVGADTYSLRFREVEFPGSTDVAWTCTSSADGTLTGKCNGWRMESASGGSLARLLKITTVKGKTTTKSGSLFYFTFKVDVKIPGL
jgi:hypothetical protein